MSDEQSKSSTYSKYKGETMKTFAVEYVREMSYMHWIDKVSAKDEAEAREKVRSKYGKSTSIVQIIEQ